MTQSKPTDQKPKQKRSIETRERIIEAGEKLFSQDGYHATSTKKIAKEAGVSVGSVYNYFPDKKAMMLEIYAHHSSLMHGMILESLKDADFASLGRDGLAVTRMIVEQSLKLHTFSPEFHREISMLRYSDPDFAALNAQEMMRIVWMLVSILEPAREKLRVDDLEAAAYVIASAVEEVVHSIKMFDAPIDEERLAAALADMIHSYLFKDSPNPILDPPAGG